MESFLNTQVINQLKLPESVFVLLYLFYVHIGRIRMDEAQQDELMILLMQKYQFPNQHVKLVKHF